ncbi:hypothetical protein BDZ45DRAFT_784191 [Acephala macrosclerotiorum]|nr:hypothetical protein BDZ45DRAFT_784191 [Acephala macrosclerotiorum]
MRLPSPPSIDFHSGAVILSSYPYPNNDSKRYIFPSSQLFLPPVETDFILPDLDKPPRKATILIGLTSMTLTVFHPHSYLIATRILKVIMRHQESWLDARHTSLKDASACAPV